jgi:hypothetical protein
VLESSDKNSLADFEPWKIQVRKQLFVQDPDMPCAFAMIQSQSKRTSDAEANNLVF